MLQIHDNGCLEGPWRETGEKETLAMSTKLCSFHFNSVKNAASSELCSFHFSSVRNAASSEGRALGTCSVGMVGERE